MSSVTLNTTPYADRLHAAMGFNRELKGITGKMRELSQMHALFEAALRNIKPTMEDLIDAPRTLAAKDAVMKSMQIIPVPLSAMYLGIPEDAIYNFKRKVGPLFGAMRYQSICFSIKELETFAQNRDWFEEESEHCGPIDRKTPPISFLLQGTFVGADIMLGYLAVNNIASRLGIPQNGSARRPFRLSDIRIEFIKRFPEVAPYDLSAKVQESYALRDLMIEPVGAIN